MKQILLILCSFVCLGLQAQDIYHDMPFVSVHQDSTITNMLNDKINNRERQLVEIQGYRVQIYSSNKQKTAKTEAFELEKRLTKMNLSEQIYVQYNPPFWKVRVGDFKTQEDAQILREQLITLLPERQGDIYIVRDLVTVYE